jgi:aminoglycoside phosphotransferase (APT) family kinase protein
METATDLLAAARAHGLELSAERAELDRSGMDFVVLHAVDEAGTPWIVKRPRRPDVAERSAAERRILSFLAPRLAQIGVRVPDLAVCAPDLVAYPRLPGTPAWSVDPATLEIAWHVDPAALTPDLSSTLADLLSALHAVGAEEVAAAGVRVETAAQAREALAREMDEARGVLEIGEAIWRGWQGWLEDDASWTWPAVLAHGDLQPGHLLIDASGRVGGVLDWT